MYTLSEKPLFPLWSVLDAEPGVVRDDWPGDIDADAAIQSVTFFDRWTFESYYSKDQTSIDVLQFDDQLDMEVLCVAEFKAFAMYYFMDFVKTDGITKVVEPQQE
jgi:hypothetical protein